VTSFALGMQSFIAGFGLITKPGIKRLVFIPLLINVCLFVVLFFVFRYFVSEFNHWFAAHLPSWLQWLSAILWLLFFISFFLFFVATFVAFANIISAPFNSLLSDAVERYLTGQAQPSRGFYENMKDIPRVIGRQLAVLGFYLPRALLLLMLFFIPIIQAVAAIFWFLFNAWYMTLTYLDYPTDNHRISFKATRAWLKERRLEGLGFGVSVLIAAMIPVFNLLVMPAAVAGATHYWLKSQKNKLS
jgi:CysZ protein